MTNSSVRAAATGLPETDHAAPSPLVLTAPENCRAFQLGAEIGRLAAEVAPLQRAGATGPDMSLELRLLERIDALSEALALSPATSIPGGLAQVIVSFDWVSDVAFGHSLSQEEVARVLKAVQRCLFSVANLLAVQGGVPASFFGGERLMPAHMNDLRLSEPSAASRPSSDGSFVEDELLRLNASTDQWWALYDDVGKFPDAGPAASQALDELCEKTSCRAIGATRENLETALALPAASVRELGLQARIIAAELREWWIDHDVPEGETACRILLDRLMGLAGVTRPTRYEPSLEEARSWFADILAEQRRIEAAANEPAPGTPRH